MMRGRQADGSGRQPRIGLHRSIGLEKEALRDGTIGGDAMKTPDERTWSMSRESRSCLTDNGTTCGIPTYLRHRLFFARITETRASVVKAP